MWSHLISYGPSAERIHLIPSDPSDPCDPIWHILSSTFLGAENSPAPPCLIACHLIFDTERHGCLGTFICLVDNWRFWAGAVTALCAGVVCLGVAELLRARGAASIALNFIYLLPNPPAFLGNPSIPPSSTRLRMRSAAISAIAAS